MNTDATISRIAEALESKPASYFEKAVRHLWLVNFSSEARDTSLELLQILPRIENLVIMDSIYPFSDPEIERSIGAKCTRLGLIVHATGSWYHTKRLVEPLYSFVTHLIIHERRGSGWHSWSRLAELPALTHLCLAQTLSADLLRQALVECPTLHVVVRLWFQRKEAEDFVTYPKNDSRLVVMWLAKNYRADWETGAYGGDDFWARAEQFLERKMRGEIETQPGGAYSYSPSTSMNYFDELPPELISLLPPRLSTVSLGALILTCRRMREILQPELESRITPQLGRQLLLWAAASKPHIVAKLLSPPHFIPPNVPRFFAKAPLHVAASAGQLEIVTMLLEAGADPAANWDQEVYQALHLAAENKDLPIMRLLLDHGAPINSTFGADGCRENALHLACKLGHMEMIALLLERGANIESRGHFGSALGFAVHWGRLDVVKLLLAEGADASVTVPLYILMAGGPPLPHKADLLYIAMNLRAPSSPLWRLGRKPGSEQKWEGLPLREDQKTLMALLMEHGARKDKALATISKHLRALAEEALCTEEEYLAMVEGMLKEAEDAIPDVSPVLN
ncbi:ankyrin repeat-containing domain protein [Mycena vulgaris]|nr:ankyrin repeat-containing domain protein [Mycena vulgaris]